MRSSTSNSELNAKGVDRAPSNANRYFIWSVHALVSLGVFCIGIEALTRFGFAHISRIEARVSTDYQVARSIRANTHSVLLIGNSLLLEGIDSSRLRIALAGYANPVVFPIEQTEYLDWYYGMRRLFAEGSRPEMVILCMSADHLVSSRIRGDYSAYYLFLLSDIPRIRREVGYDLTQASGLVLSRFSLFYAGRTSLRNFVLVRTDPAYADMLQQIAAAKAHAGSDEDIEPIAEARLAAFRQLCALHGTRFLFLLPPGFGGGEAPVIAAGEHAHVTMSVPFHLNALGADQFRDGFHLNASGARIFTDKVSEMLKAHLEH